MFLDSKILLLLLSLLCHLAAASRGTRLSAEVLCPDRVRAQLLGSSRAAMGPGREAVCSPVNSTPGFLPACSSLCVYSSALPPGWAPNPTACCLVAALLLSRGLWFLTFILQIHVASLARRQGTRRATSLVGGPLSFPELGLTPSFTDKGSEWRGRNWSKDIQLLSALQT